MTKARALVLRTWSAELKAATYDKAVIRVGRGPSRRTLLREAMERRQASFARARAIYRETRSWKRTAERLAIMLSDYEE